MKYLNSLYFLMLCIAITLSSCNNGIEPNDNAIRFSYTDETRAAGSNDTVAVLWGYSDNANVGTDGWVYNSASGLEAKLSLGSVSIDGLGDPEYWTSDSYYFYSLWPLIEEAEVYRTVNKGKKGLCFWLDARDQIDYRIAYFSVSAGEAASRTAPVHFEYKHILSNLIFNVQKNTANVQDSIILLSFALHNVNYQGDCIYRDTSVPNWPDDVFNRNDSLVLYSYELNSDSTFETTPLYIDARVGTKVNGTGGYLVIPQNLRRTSDDDVVSLSLAYGFVAKNSNKVYSKNYVSVTIPVSTIAQWEQNKKYTYNIYLAAESNDIIFGTPKVSSWNRRQGGSTIIVQ